MFMKRLIFNLFVIFFSFWLPWYFLVLGALIGLFLFKNFYEFIFLGVLFYGLYLIPGQNLINSPIFFSFLVIGLYFLFNFIKQRIIFYQNEFSY
jgi:hypothetical protein